MNKEQKTQELLEKITQEGHDQKLLSPLLRSVAFSLVTVLYISFVVYFIYNPRSDMMEKYASLTFTLEQFSALMTGFLAAFVAMWSTIPGETSSKRLKWIPLVTLGSILLFVGIGDFIWHEHLSSQSLLIGMHCAANISLIALLPLLVLIHLALKAAPTRPLFTGFFILLSVASFGYFGVRSVCPDDGLQHQMTAHILPLLIYSALGFWIGRKFLKW